MNLEKIRRETGINWVQEPISPSDLALFQGDPKIVTTTPTAFLKEHTDQIYQLRLHKPTLTDLTKILAENKPMYIPTTMHCPAVQQNFSNGCHRAILCLILGIKKMPVLHVSLQDDIYPRPQWKDDKLEHVYFGRRSSQFVTASNYEDLWFL